EQRHLAQIQHHDIACLLFRGKIDNLFGEIQRLQASDSSNSGLLLDYITSGRRFGAHSLVTDGAVSCQSLAISHQPLVSLRSAARFSSGPSALMLSSECLHHRDPVVKQPVAAWARSWTLANS